MNAKNSRTAVEPKNAQCPRFLLPSLPRSCKGLRFFVACGCTYCIRDTRVRPRFSVLSLDPLPPFRPLALAQSNHRAIFPIRRGARPKPQRAREWARGSHARLLSVGRLGSPLLASYREAHRVGDLGWVDLDFDCCTELGRRGRGAVDKMAEHRNPS